MKKKVKVESVKTIEDTSSDIDVALLSEEDLENSGLRELVDKGKEQGFLSYEEINSMLPDDISDPDQVEETIQMLIDIGIEVLEKPGVSEDEVGSAPETVPDTRSTLTTVESEIGRTTDPVRLYMREMGTVDLLTREGEIAIAKRIEAGRERMIGAICESPMTIRSIINWKDSIKEGTMLLRDIVDLEQTYDMSDIGDTKVEDTLKLLEGDSNKKDEQKKVVLVT